jgi:hypothetical protein
LLSSPSSATVSMSWADNSIPVATNSVPVFSPRSDGRENVHLVFQRGLARVSVLRSWRVVRSLGMRLDNAHSWLLGMSPEP